MEDSNYLNGLIDQNKEELFCELDDELSCDSVTDVEWDGYNLWIGDLNKGCCLSGKKLSEAYVDNLSIRLANIMKVSFNRSNPILEANTDELRISIWHESRSGRKSVAIRKIPKRLRFDHRTIINSGYAPERLINLLENCTIGHCNSVIGGQPHAGKTELLKYLSTFIPFNEKVGVYEDNQEIHYRTINPGKKCSEFFVDERFPYSKIIKAGLRHNIDWMLLSESRGPEVLDLLNCLSTGSYCMTTMHLDNIRGLPDRMYNMLGESNVTERFINSIYKYIDMGILVECDSSERRRIMEVGFYTRSEGQNECIVVYENGEFTGEELPMQVKDKLKKHGIVNEYERGGV